MKGKYTVIIKQWQQFEVDDLTQIEHEYANSDFHILDHEIESVYDDETGKFIDLKDLPEQEEE